MKHVLIHGPSACGKSRHKAELAKALNCDAIEDDVTLAMFKELAVSAGVRTLFLTNEDPGLNNFGVQRRAEVLRYDFAMYRAGLAA
jgi:cytidylate kinase